METKTLYENGQNSNRRECTEGSNSNRHTEKPREVLKWDYDGRGLSKVSNYYKEIGDDLGRRERMAEAMYDC